jgi:translation elongation factor EF-1alpha
MGRTGELSPTRQVASFEAKVIVVQLHGRIRNRYESVIRCHTAAVCCRWEFLAKVFTLFFFLSVVCL